jgi:foldase protein PrsA
MKKFLVILLVLVAITSVAGNVLLYKRYSTQRPLMHIGSESIKIKDYRDQVDYQAGKAVLNKMAYAMLILQEAKKANLIPTEDDIAKRLATIERRVPKALEAARSDAQKMAELKRDLTTDIALENLTIKDVKVTDAEVRAFYAKNKALFQVPAQARTTIVLAQNDVDAKTAASLLNNPSMTPDIIANQPRLRVVGVNGYKVDWNAVPTRTQEELARAIFAAKVKQVTTVRAGTAFLVARVDGRETSGIEPFEKVRPTVERLAKLKKAPSGPVVLARLYKGANVSFEIGKYAEYFSDIEKFAKDAETAPVQQTASAK